VFGAELAPLAVLPLDADVESVGSGGGGGGKLLAELDDADEAVDVLLALSKALRSALTSLLTAEVLLLDVDAEPPDDSRSARLLDESELDDADDVPPRELTRLSSNAVMLLLVLELLSDDGAVPLSGGGGGGCTPPMEAKLLAALDDDAETLPTCWACKSADCVTALNCWKADFRSVALTLTLDDAVEALEDEEVELALFVSRLLSEEVLALLTLLARWPPPWMWCMPPPLPDIVILMTVLRSSSWPF